MHPHRWSKKICRMMLSSTILLTMEMPRQIPKSTLFKNASICSRRSSKLGDYIASTGQCPPHESLVVKPPIKEAARKACGTDAFLVGSGYCCEHCLIGGGYNTCIAACPPCRLYCSTMCGHAVSQECASPTASDSTRPSRSTSWDLVVYSR